MSANPPHQTCTKHRTDGQPCRAIAIPGTDACDNHSGRDKATHRARGQIVLALRKWNADDIPEDPALLALKLMTITSWRQQAYEDEINRVLAESGLQLSEALIGETIIVDKDGSPHVVGEYVRGIVQLEQTERKLAADLAFKVLAANVSERLTRVQEQVGTLVADMVRALFADPELGLTAEQLQRAPVVAARHLRALGPGGAA